MSFKMIRLVFLAMLLVGPISASPYFLLDSKTEWDDVLGSGAISPLPETGWTPYLDQWNHWPWYEGEPFALGERMPFCEASLIAVDDSEPAVSPSDEGLVMYWGPDGPSPEHGNYASAWQWEYGLNPDLTHCTIKVTVSPPEFGLFGSDGFINAVSFGIRDANGAVRAWWWGCGPGQPLQASPATTITIDTSKMGVGATTPQATGFVNNPDFNIKNSSSFILAENAKWLSGPLPESQFGNLTLVGLWNYWQNVQVMPNTSSNAYKGTYVKYSQPPVVISEPGQVPSQIYGWDETSVYPPEPQPITQITADDWLCKDDRPVTDFHWWGSYVGWTQPYPPPMVPQAFHIGIWTDIKANEGVPPLPYSHPGVLIWQKTCPNWVWNFAGYDVPPEGMPGAPINEACFQFNQLLSEPDWFQPESGEHTYWLSIAAIYPAEAQVQYPWGWKTRPHKYQDDAVRTTVINPWPPVINSSQWLAGTPVEFPVGTSWDLAFEITTNMPDYCDKPIPGDINGDKIVDLTDFSILASNWLVTAP
jgi:hypothetical protein